MKPKGVAGVFLLCVLGLWGNLAAAGGHRICRWRCDPTAAAAWDAQADAWGPQAAQQLPQSFLDDAAERAAEEAIRLLVERIRQRRGAPQPSRIDAQLEEIRGDLRDLQGKVESLQGQVAGIDARLAALESPPPVKPDPKPKPPKPDPPSDAAVDPASVRIYVVNEKVQASPQATQVIHEVHKFAEAKKYRYREFDPQQTAATLTAEDVAALPRVLQPQPAGLPRLIVERGGKEVYRKLLPATAAAATADIERALRAK